MATSPSQLATSRFLLRLKKKKELIRSQSPRWDPPGPEDGTDARSYRPPDPCVGAEAPSLSNPRMGASGKGRCQVLRNQNQGSIPGGPEIKAPVLLPFTSCLFRIASLSFLCSILARKLWDPALWTSQVGQHFRWVHGLGFSHPDWFYKAERLHSRQKWERWRRFTLYILWLSPLAYLAF